MCDQEKLKKKYEEKAKGDVSYTKDGVRVSTGINKNEKIEGDVKVEYVGSRESTVHGTSTSTIKGTSISNMYGEKISTTAGAVLERSLAFKQSVTAGVSIELSAGLKASQFLGGALTGSTPWIVDNSDVFSKTRSNAILLDGSGPKILLGGGKVIIEGVQILLNGNSKVFGNLDVTGTLKVTKKCFMNKKVSVKDKLSVDDAIKSPSIKTKNLKA